MQTRNGFTLIELSIVLTILALLVGAILGGQTLLRASQLRSITTDVEKFKTAITTFQDTYNALPGDMPNATSYWGEAHATPSTCKTTVGSGTQTCNGDGDGRISNPYGVNAYEAFRAWQHLANAGLVEGNYTGVAGTGSAADSDIKVNVPASRVTGTGYTLWNWADYTSSDFFSTKYDHVMIYGSEAYVYQTFGEAIAAAEAFAIDQKVDNGKPGTGKILSMKPSGYTPNCATTSSENTAAYKIGSDANLCSLIFKLGF